MISLLDIWVLADDYGARGYRWVAYFPVDTQPVAPAVLRKISKAYLPVVYSRFAAAECAARRT